jgi:hypothetical protein
MPNGEKNNGKKEIELLPEELRRPEERRRRREEKPEVKLFVPSIEPKPVKPSFIGKFFGEKKTLKPTEKPKENVPEYLSVFGIQKEARRPPPPPPPKPIPPPPPPKPIPPPPPPRPVPPPKTSKQPAVGKGFSEPRSKIGITLIPEEKISPEEAARPKQKAVLMAIIVLLVLILGGAFGVLKWYQNKIRADIEKIDRDIALIEKQIKDLDSEKKQAEILQKQFKVAAKLLGEHVYWSGICAFLEKNTVSDVYFKNFVGGSDGQIVMSAVAKSYRAVAEQILAFRAVEEIEKVFITSATASVSPTGETAEVNFEAKIKLKQEIFLK